MKIFCIGFHKTGTTSLGNALRVLGYRVRETVRPKHPDIASRYRQWAFERVGRYDAFTDNPWPLLYRELDAAYPGSRFILTIRSEDAWIESIKNHCEDRETPMRTLIYGHPNPIGHEDAYLETYRRHNAAVQEYFQGRDRDLLSMDITRGEAWEILCPFLGHEIPSRPFPHLRKASERGTRRTRTSREVVTRRVSRT